MTYLYLEDYLSTIGDDMSTKGLADALFPRTRLAILKELVSVGDEGLHLRELERRTGLNSRGVMRELHSLRDAGILISREVGRQVIYRLNPDCPIYPELHSLILKTAGLADVLRAVLLPFVKRIELAYVYGSFASGEANAESDVDLLIVGDVSLRELASSLRRAAETLSREVNPTVYQSEDYHARLTQEDSFVFRVHNGPRIDLLGEVAR